MDRRGPPEKSLFVVLARRSARSRVDDTPVEIIAMLVTDLAEPLQCFRMPVVDGRNVLGPSGEVVVHRRSTGIVQHVPLISPRVDEELEVLASCLRR